MTDLTALRAALDKLKSTAQAVVSSVPTGSSTDVSQADVDALVTEVESVEAELASVKTGPDAPAGAGVDPSPAASAPAASTAPEPSPPDPSTPPAESQQPPWATSSS